MKFSRLRCSNSSNHLPMEPALIYDSLMLPSQCCNGHKLCGKCLYEEQASRLPRFNIFICTCPAGEANAFFSVYTPFPPRRSVVCSICLFNGKQKCPTCNESLSLYLEADNSSKASNLMHFQPYMKKLRETEMNEENDAIESLRNEINDSSIQFSSKSISNGYLFMPEQEKRDKLMHLIFLMKNKKFE
jgi:hypothetical protein